MQLNPVLLSHQQCGARGSGERLLRVRASRAGLWHRFIEELAGIRVTASLLPHHPGFKPLPQGLRSGIFGCLGKVKEVG